MIADVFFQPRQPLSDKRDKDRADWEDLIKNLELRPDARRNISQAVDADDDTEWRVRSSYLLTNVIGIAPERVNAVHQRRLGTVMRKLGWSGPKNIKFETTQAKGYFREAEEVSL